MLREPAPGLGVLAVDGSRRHRGELREERDFPAEVLPDGGDRGSLGELAGLLVPARRVPERGKIEEANAHGDIVERAPGPGGEGNRGEVMKHEYKVIHVLTPESVSLEKILNDHASEGWLLDKLTQDIEGRPVYVILMRVR